MTGRVLSVSLAGLCTIVLAGCEPSHEELVARSTQTIHHYCLDCHNAVDRQGGLVLEGMDLDQTEANAPALEKVVRKLRGHMMPPPGGPRPDKKSVDSLVSFLETSLDAAAEAHPRIGPEPIHRLNRTEYGNAIRDLLGLHIDPAQYLPADDEGYGFDNIADILRVSPSLLDQYLSASSKIATLAVGDADIRPVSTIYRAPPDLAQSEHIEGLPLGTRGGLLIDHYFPLDAKYDFSVFLQRNIVGYMTGLEWPHQLEISIDDQRVFLAPVGGDEDNAMSDANFSAAADKIDARLRTQVFVKAGEHKVGVTFVRRDSAESHEPLQLHTRNLDLQDMNGLPIIDYVNLIGPIEPTGPGDTESRRRIFICEPKEEADELPCAEQILSNLARRAYRGPVGEKDLGLLLDIYKNGRKRGGFERGIQSALRMLLASPKFVFRSQPDPGDLAPGTIYPLDDLALASRLSFFLWSSLPDHELLDLAEQHELSDPKVYEQQVRRMLADPRSESLVTNFAAQWLFLRNLNSARPDINTFPDYDENLRRAMRRETELFVESIIKQDRSVMDFLTADYTFLNERLAKHYGIPGVYGSRFRRVQLQNDARRGLLGQGSILTVTSYPNRTSPVLRGKYILTNLLGTPPPSPPPNVPALKEAKPGEQGHSMRERMAAHRINPVCAGCHDILDPLGLALENFDAVGRYRTVDAGGPIDASGRLADGTPVDGVVGLRRALVAEPEQFVSVVAEKLMTYALGRGLDYYDMPSVRAIVRNAAKDDYRFSSLIFGIVDSDQFRERMVQPPEQTESGEVTASLQQ